ncbi:cation:proton antiporter [Nocardia sp. NBC_00508]|uniref:cation:proton antiporter n=1 Tax=Nocardia sp. NBC_00508 TaxID=2975992 RepID=UPI002E805DDE|nr:cation:proton antiporter [Nocardia sp. NBC_00508]WUD65991.1 cation:proton antiporter [Nocardia sp. NBC_00508]
MSSGQVVVVFVDLVVIMVAARATGWLAEKVGQPAVIGEIAAGIVAGPTVLGPAVSGALFPHEARSYLSLLASVGIAVFMFLAGLELDGSVFSGRRRTIPVVSTAAYAVPFLLGCGLAAVALSRHRIGDGRYFALFLGCALAVTAFPVLARILHDHRLIRTPIGQISLACAAVVDLLAWSALAVVLAFANPVIGGQWRWAVLIPVVGLTWWVVRPVLMRLASFGTDQTMIVVGIGGALLLGAVTEWVGLHLVFGAFAFGLVFPRGRRAAVESGARVLSSVLLPAFFVVAGLAVDLGALDATALGELAIIVAAAVLGKVGSVYAVGRMVGLGARAAAGVAALLNTRGLTELVILNVGLSVGLITGPLYSLLVVMALVTTAMTAPMLRLVGVTSARSVVQAAPHDDGAGAGAEGTSVRTRTA